MRKQGKKLLALGLSAALAVTSVSFAGFDAKSLTAKAAPNTTASVTTSGGAITTEEGQELASTNNVYVPDNPSSFLDLSSDELIEEMGNGWNLGNTLDGHSELAPNETAWRESKVYTSQEFITYLHDIGYNTIRIPVTWGTMINDDYSVNEAWMSRVQDVVDYAINENMYVILNIHHDGADGDYWFNLDADEESNPNNDKYNQGWTEKWDNGGWAGVKEKFAGLWTTISDRFKNYDEHLIFEAMNEVFSANKGGWTNDPALIKAQTTQINELNQLFVNTVRATGGNNGKRWIMASALNTNIGYATMNGTGFKIPTDKNEQKRIMLSVHDYDAYNATSTNEGSSSSYAGQFKTLYNMYVKEGVPVVIGEYGFKHGTLANLRASQYEGVNYLLKKYHLVGCVWDDAGNYRLLNRGYMKPYSKKSIVGTMRGFFKDTSAPAFISFDNYKEIINNNIESFSLAESSLDMTIGQRKTVSYTATPADNNDVVLWSSSDPTVASAYNGKIVARKAGTATITARTISSELLDGKAKAQTITVTVKSAALDNATTGITTDFEQYELYKNDEAFINATIANADNGAYVTYASSNPAVATVSTTGKILALKPGTTKITVASTDGYTKAVPVTVKAVDSSTPYDVELGLKLLYNYNKDADTYYGQTEQSTQTVHVTKNGQYSLTFDCSKDLSKAAKDFGISTISQIGALYITDLTKATSSVIKAGNIKYDSITLNDTITTTITQTEPKSFMKGSKIDTGDPINCWDGSVLSADDLKSESNGSVSFKKSANVTKITITFTLSDISLEVEEEFYRGTDKAVDDDTIVPSTDDDSDDNSNNNTNTIPGTKVVAKTGSLSAPAKTIVAAGASKTISYNATLASGATKLAKVTAKSSDSKVKVAVNEATKKLTITADKKATKGKTATITLSSTGAKDVKIKVVIKNPTKKLTATKKLTLKKKKSKTITVKVTASNKKYATTDTVKVTSSKKKIAKVSAIKIKKGKITFKVKAQKKKGSSKLTVKVGSKKVTINVKVK